VPALRHAVNDARTGLSRGFKGLGALRRTAAEESFERAQAAPGDRLNLVRTCEIPNHISPFLRISKRSGAPYDGVRGHADRDRRSFENNWLAPMDPSHLAQHAGTAGTVFASIFVVSMTTMKTMVPLRVFGILLNLVLIATAIPSHNYLTIVVQLVVLVLNAYRLHQMLQLIRDVRQSVNSDLSMDWLKPFMTERNCKAGEIVYYKDEKAEDMAYIVSGRFRLVESGIELPVGAIVGELGMLAPSKVRTQTVECIADGLILCVSYSKVEELYVQNPAFGFYFLRLASARLFQNIAKVQEQLDEKTALLEARQAQA
jgi:hypothetical protein